MSDTNLDLARRAVVCRGWRWMPGMRAVPKPGVLDDLSGHVVHAYKSVSDHDVLVVSGPDDYGDVQDGTVYVVDYMPDLDDPATIGCLLVLVRAAWGDPLLGLEAVDDACRRIWWQVHSPNRFAKDKGAAGRGATEAAALVAALETAPG